jgi:hypothetical protein
MIAKTGTNGDPDVEASNAESKSKESGMKESPDSETDQKKSYITRTVIVGENFDAGSYGTYVSIFILLIGEFKHSS